MEIYSVWSRPPVINAGLPRPPTIYELFCNSVPVYQGNRPPDIWYIYIFFAPAGKEEISLPRILNINQDHDEKKGIMDCRPWF